MRRVYLIRHCRPDIPEGVRMCLGSTDLPLGEAGHQQARQLGKQFAGLPLQQVFCSRLIRSQETARYLHPAPMILPGLEELDAGEWDGLTFDEIRLRYPDLYAARGIDPTLPLPGSEPEASGLLRFSAAMEQAARMANGDFAVVAHGGVISLFLQSLRMPRYKPLYGEVVLLNWDGRRYLPH